MQLSSYEDIPELAELVHLFYQETGAPFTWDQDKVESLLRMPLESPEKAVCFVEERDGSLVAFLHAIATEPSVSREKVVTEVGFYILPEWRGMDIALNMLGGLEYWAKHVAQAKYITLVSLHTMNPKKVDTFYQMNGYQISEYSYLKEI